MRTSLWVPILTWPKLLIFTLNLNLTKLISKNKCKLIPNSFPWVYRMYWKHYFYCIFIKVNKEMIAKTKNSQKSENLRPTSILPSIHGYLLVHKMLLNHCVKSVRIFLYSGWIRRFIPYPNTGKYGPEKTPY